MDNANSPEYLERIKQTVFENLKATRAAPSVQMTEVPRRPMFMGDNDGDPDGEGDVEDLDEREGRLDDEDDERNPDSRSTARKFDAKIEPEGELYDSDDEEEKEQYGVRPQTNGAKRRPGIMDHHNPYAPDENGINSGAGSPIASAAVSANDDPDSMALDPPNALAQAANSAIAEDILEAKAEENGGSGPTTAEGDAASTAAQNPPQPAADLTSAPPAPATANTQPVAGPPVTPPESPVDAPVTALLPNSTTVAAEDVEMSESAAEARNEGALERTAEDVEAEQRRETDAPQGTHLDR